MKTPKNANLQGSLKKLLIGAMVAATLLATATASAAGGDLGGGGKIANDLKLSRKEADSLRQARSSEEAFAAWRQILKRDSRDQKLMQNVFNEIILPQID